MSSREQFEAWWEINYHNGKPPRFGWAAWRDGDGYKIDDDESELDGMWNAWQAATNAMEAKCAALAAENAYLLNGAARELNTSWMFHKTMLGAQAALVCLSHGYQAAAREWLEGTTDEAGAEIPYDISVGELHEWFDSQMVSNDGNGGFLTRAEAEGAIKKACPATNAFLAEVRAQGVDMAIKAAMPEVASEFQRETFEQCVSATVRYPQSDLAGKVEMVAWLELFAAQLRQEAAQ